MKSDYIIYICRLCNITIHTHRVIKKVTSENPDVEMSAMSIFEIETKLIKQIAPTNIMMTVITQDIFKE